MLSVSVDAVAEAARQIRDLDTGEVITETELLRRYSAAPESAFDGVAKPREAMEVRDLDSGEVITEKELLRWYDAPGSAFDWVKRIQANKPGARALPSHAVRPKDQRRAKVKSGGIISSVEDGLNCIIPEAGPPGEDREMYYAILKALESLQHQASLAVKH